MSTTIENFFFVFHHFNDRKLVQLRAEENFWKVDWEEIGRGKKIDGKLLNNPRFGNDVVLIVKTREELWEMAQNLKERNREAELEDNLMKKIR